MKRKTQVLTIVRWENDTRWYEAEFICDLLGDLVVIRRWGGHHSKRQGMKKKVVTDEAEGYRFLEKIDAQRKKRTPLLERVSAQNRAIKLD
jgi:hypothetical protein